MNLPNIDKQAKILTQRRRKRAILRLRLWAGIMALITKPWKIIFIGLLGVSFVLLWNIRDTLSSPFQSSPPLLSAACQYLVALFIPLLFLLFLAGLLYLLGLPARVRAVEDILGEIGLCSRYGHAPALISSKRVKNTTVSVMTFYSLGVSLEFWEKQSAAVEDGLNIHLVETISYGGKNRGNRNIIVLTAARGAPTRREGALYDDEI